MAAYSEYDSVWLVKTSGVVLGPFSIVELVQSIRDRRISILDEVKSPQSRWGFVREHPQLSEIVRLIRNEDLDGSQITSVTITGIENTHSITGDVVSEDLTPTPLLGATPEGGIAIEGRERRLNHLTRTIPAPLPLSSWPAVAKSAKNSNRWMAVFAALAVVIGAVVWIQTRGPKTLSSGDFIKLARRYRAIGAYEKALQFYKRADAAQSLDSSVRREMVPLMLVSNQHLQESRTLLTELQPDDVDADLQWTHWRGLLLLKEGNYSGAREQFAKVLKATPGHSQALLNQMASYYLQGSYQEAQARASEIQNQGFNSHLVVATKVLSILQNPALHPSLEQLQGLSEEVLRSIQLRLDFRLEGSFILALLQQRMGRSSEVEKTLTSFLSLAPDFSKDFVPELDVDEEVLSWSRLVTMCDPLQAAYKATSEGSGLRAVCLLWKGDRSASLAVLGEAHRENPRQAILSGLYAYQLKQMGRTSEARALVMEDGEGTSSLSRFVRAQLCFDERNLRCSETLLAQILENAPWDVRALALSARVELERSQKEIAMQEIQKGLTLANNFRPLLELKDELDGVLK